MTLKGLKGGREVPMKILAFGHLPKEAGGKQTSGLSYVAFEIARALADSEKDLEYVLSCTDVNSSIKHVVNLKSGIKVIGWTKKELAIFLLAHPLLFLRLLSSAISYCHRYRDERGIIRTLGALLLYAAAIQYHSPDLLHIHGADRAVLLDFIPNTKGLPRVTTLHGVIGFDANLPAGCQAVERDALKTNSYFVFVSNKTKDTILSNYKTVPSRYTVIPNGIDLQKFMLLDQNQCRRELDLPLNKTILLTVGSLSKLKGQGLILASIASLPHNVRKKICCVFVGNGVSALQDRRESADLELHLYDHVEQHKLVQIYNAADYHLSASSSEGFGMVMTESLACGTPIILPKTCDLVEEKFVIDGENSMLYEEPSREAIQSAVQRALSSRFCRQTVRNTVVDMSWEQIAACYRELFRLFSSRGSQENRRPGGVGKNQTSKRPGIRK